MKILITGLGISGKSTLRRRLVALSKKACGTPFFQFDADRFEEVRDPLDAEQAIKDPARCLRLLLDGKVANRKRLIVVEDVHALDEKAVAPLALYDLVLYVEADPLSYVRFWLDRAKRWYENGQFSWKPGRGWLGTGKANDSRNLLPIAKEFARACAKREEWLREDAEALRDCLVVRVKSHWNPAGPPAFTIDF